MVFREPVHQILDKIKNEPYFRWPNKMGGNPTKRNQSLHCQYHQDRGHNIEECRTLWNHLEQLVKIGMLNQFLYQPNGLNSQIGSGTQKSASSRSPLGTISVILTAPGRTSSHPSRVMSIDRSFVEILIPDPKRSRMEVQPTLTFSDEDKVGTLQPHDDALVVTLRIGGYDVKKFLVDQGSDVEIMYPNLFKGLKLKP